MVGTDEKLHRSHKLSIQFIAADEVAPTLRHLTFCQLADELWDSQVHEVVPVALAVPDELANRLKQELGTGVRSRYGKVVVEADLLPNHAKTTGRCQPSAARPSCCLREPHRSGPSR